MPRRVPASADGTGVRLGTAAVPEPPLAPDTAVYVPSIRSCVTVSPTTVPGVANVSIAPTSKRSRNTFARSGESVRPSPDAPGSGAIAVGSAVEAAPCRSDRIGKFDVRVDRRASGHRSGQEIAHVADQGETVRAESWHVLVLQGELDLDSAPDLRRALLDAINQGHHMIVVDLTEATFIDSSGLGVLVNALRRLHGVDGELRVAAGRRSITTAIEMSGLDKLLGLFPDVDSALTAEVIRGTRLRAPNGQTDG